MRTGVMKRQQMCVSGGSRLRNERTLPRGFLTLIAVD